MNIIVTGGAGFIGSNFIYYMLKKHPSDRIICVDKLTYAGNLETLESAMEKKNFKFIRADIADRRAVYRIFEQEKPDIVVNFAAESHVDRSIENPEIFLQTNVIGTSVLLDACRKYGIDRYHQVSTDEVYGDLPLTARISSSRRRRTSRHRARIRLRRPVPTCSSWPTIAPTRSRRRSRAARTTTARTTSRRSSSR